MDTATGSDEAAVEAAAASDETDVEAAANGDDEAPTNDQAPGDDIFYILKIQPKRLFTQNLEHFQKIFFGRQNEYSWPKLSNFDDSLPIFVDLRIIFGHKSMIKRKINSIDNSSITFSLFIFKIPLLTFLYVHTCIEDEIGRDYSNDQPQDLEAENKKGKGMDDVKEKGEDEEEAEEAEEEEEKDSNEEGEAKEEAEAPASEAKAESEEVESGKRVCACNYRDNVLYRSIHP